MAQANTNEIRALTEDEIARLEEALGQPIEQNYLSRWVLQGIQVFLGFMTLPSPRARRDELKEIAEQGQKWIATLERSRIARLLPLPLDLEQLVSSARTVWLLSRWRASWTRRSDQVILERTSLWTHFSSV